MAGLTFKQQFFVKHYIIERNATKAAIAAGYSEATAEAAGSRLLRNVKVQAAIQKRLGKIFDDLDASQERIINELCLVAFARMMDYIRIQGREAYINLSNLTPEQSAAITELTSDVLVKGTEKNGDGEDVPIQIKRTKIKIGGKLEALKMLAQYRKLLTDKGEHSGSSDKDDAPVRVLLVGKLKPAGDAQ